MATIKIKEKYVSFTGLITVGKKALFILFDTFGHPFEVKDLVKQCLNFNVVVFEGFECDVFEQRDSFVELVKNIKKENSMCEIIVYTTAEIKPIGLSSLDIKFIVNIQLSNTNKDLDKRINSSIINYYVQSNSRFYSKIESIEEIDEIILIANDNNIPRHLLYISFNNPELTDSVLDMCKLNNINFAPDLKFMFWNNIGRE